MALFIRQDEKKSELQNRLATELQNRAKLKTSVEDLPDGVDESRYLQGTEKTKSMFWFWAIFALIIGLIVLFLVNGMAR